MNERMPFGLFSFSLRCSLPSPIAELPTNSIARILIFGPSLAVKVTLTSFGPPATGVTVWSTTALVKPFSAIISRTTRLDAAHLRLVEERVEPDLDVALAQLLVDVGALDDADRLAVAVLVVDDLDALALLQLVDDHLADDAVREHVVGHLDRHVLEEVGVEHQRPEVGERHLLGRLVPRAGRRPARARSIWSSRLGCSTGRSRPRRSARCPASGSRARRSRGTAASRPAAAPPARPSGDAAGVGGDGLRARCGLGRGAPWAAGPARAPARGQQRWPAATRRASVRRNCCCIKGES